MSEPLLKMADVFGEVDRPWQGLESLLDELGGCELDSLPKRLDEIAEAKLCVERAMSTFHDIVQTADDRIDEHEAAALAGMTAEDIATLVTIARQVPGNLDAIYLSTPTWLLVYGEAPSTPVAPNEIGAPW